MLEWSATELSRAIHGRKVAPSEVMSAWLAQVKAMNGAVNAIVSLRDADVLMEEAQALDGVTPLGWLHGIPFAIKDLVATSGLRTTWGSSIYADHVPVKDYVYYLAGYVADDLVTRGQSHNRPYSQRQIDVGYRGRQLPFYMGRGGQEKATHGDRLMFGSAKRTGRKRSHGAPSRE